MKANQWLRLVAWCLTAVAGVLVATPGRADEIKSVKSFYYGNSFTGNTMPGLHPELVKGTDRQWQVGAAIAAGVPIWSHMKDVMDKSAPAMKGIEGDYDAVVVQVFAGEGLEKVVTEMWQGKIKFGQPTDVGDIAAVTYIAKAFLAAHPAARAYVYTSWPGIPVEELATEGGATLKAGEKFNKAGLSEEQMEVFRKKFDYEKAWLADYDPANPKGKTHTRAHMYAVMEGVKKNLPDLWSEGRLGMIPVGDVFLAIDKKMRSGAVPGLENIGQYYSNGHLRAGLPRYTLAATFYAVLFRDHPQRLKYQMYDDIGNFAAGKFGYYVHQPDLGQKVDITPERAKIVNDTIWEVVTHHPHTGVKK